MVRSAAKQYGKPVLVELWRASEASVAVETAMVLPVFIFVLFTIVAGGQIMWTQVALQYAVTTAARCATIGSSQCPDVTSYAASQALGLSIPSSAFTYVPQANCNVSGYASGSQVTASYSLANSIIAQLIPPMSSLTLTASACQP
jgi:Flp pilus assembly protein TadG